ncbi:class I SAM-dependent methyltransferase [Shewanella sedimentimangrovi]|nr:class I SAM-dependent methyltransferase [Shewanella sedimentimangrovi]
MKHKWLLGICVLTKLLLMQAQAAENVDAIDSAIAASERPATDRAKDANRHPQEILHFFEVRPGQQILDLFSGGGYYTELLARTVGPRGKVVAHNNQAYLPFAAEDLKRRSYSERLPNVESLIAEANDLNFADASFDRIFFVLGFHDTYFHDDSWPAIDVDRLTALFYRALKADGYVAIIDHATVPGADVSSAEKLHRIDRSEVIRRMEQAGFKLLDSTAVLENPDDPLTLSVFDPSVRGKTSRFVLKFGRGH